MLVIDAEIRTAILASVRLAPEQYTPEIGILTYQVYLVGMMAPG
jgi:hypothetical protein